MYRRRCILLAFCAVAMALAASLFADSLSMSDNRPFPLVQVDSWSAPQEGAGEGTFQIRMSENGVVGAQAYPVLESAVQWIDFSPPSNILEKGRRADMTMTENRSFPGVTVLRFEKAAAGSQFLIRPAGADASAQGYPVAAKEIILLNFQQTPAAGTQTPVSMPGMIPGISDRGVPGESAEAEGAIEDPMGTADRVLNQIEAKVEEQEVREKKKTPMQKLMARLKEWLISVAISALIGGLVVYYVCKNSQDEVPFGKAYLVGLALATIPSLLATACLFVPLCCLSLILAIVVWYYSALTIIQTLIDVKKNTATTIIIVYIIMEIIVKVAVFFIMTGAFLLSALQ